MSKQSSLRNKILLPVIGGIVFYILMCIYAGRGELMEAFSRCHLSLQLCDGYHARKAG